MSAIAARGRGAARFFFLYLGIPFLVIVYFDQCGRAGYSAEGVRHALWIGLLVTTAYGVLASWCGELKQLDVGLWTLLAAGTVATRAGVAPATALFQRYSPALVSLAFGVTVLLPLLLGREPFTVHYARRQVPAWQQKLPSFAAVNRVLTAYWALVFFVAAGLAAWAPQDPRFTALYPNLVIVGLGLPAPLWLPALYFRLVPPGTPATIEGVLLGMPFAFNRAAAGDVRARIQFRVSGAEAGDYWLRIADGRCESFPGVAPGADATVHTPDRVWLQVVHHELDAGQALQQGLYRIEGDVALVAKLGEWFGARA